MPRRLQFPADGGYSAGEITPAEESGTNWGPGIGYGGVELDIPDASKAKRILGMPEFREVAETAVDAAWSLLEVEKATKRATDLRV